MNLRSGIAGLLKRGSGGSGITRIQDASDVSLAGMGDGDFLRWDASNGAFYPGDVPPQALSPWYEYSAGGLLVPRVRGALVKKAADQTTADYTSFTAVAWDNEGTGCYDTDSIHDTVTNNTRLSVPSGISYVRLSFNLALSAVTADGWTTAAVSKNGSTSYPGRISITTESGNTSPALSGCSPPLPVVGGTDYFELGLQTEADNSITVAAASSWFAMELVA